MKYVINTVIAFFALGMTSCNVQERDSTTWEIYRGDAASTSYSSLEQINKENVGQLEVAWIFDPNDARAGTRLPKYECNPIIIDTVMYATSARHWVYALDARSGSKIWSFDPFNGEPGGGIKRGVTFWEKNGEQRILFTAGEHLYALNAITGLPVQDFGMDGKIRLDTGLGPHPGLHLGHSNFSWYSLQ